MNKVKWIVFITLIIWVSPITVMAGDFDGSTPLICAIMETFECVPGGECQRGTAMSINGTLILQGIQDGKAWSMVISESDGMATISVSENEAGFVLFGACTTP